jgi:hypothetical protein
MESPKEPKWLGYTKVYAAFGGAALLFVVVCYMFYTIFFPNPLPEPIRSLLARIPPPTENDILTIGFIITFCIIFELKNVTAAMGTKVEAQLKEMNDTLKQILRK